MYQKLILHEPPRIRFAHAYSTENYDISFRAANYISHLELTFFEQGDVIQESQGCEPLFIPEGGFHLFTLRSDRRVYSHASPCSHITVGFEADYTQTTVSREELISANRSEDKYASMTFFCPTASLMPEVGSSMENTLRRLISLFALPDAAQTLRSHALLYELLAALTEGTIRQAMLEEGSLSPSGILYARRAMRYIAANLTGKLTVDDIASHLGISAGYLSALFKAYTGESIISYANSIRVERIRDLLISRSLNLKEAGESVGLSDENYMSRLFRQYTGQSVREFLRSNRSSARE